MKNGNGKNPIQNIGVGRNANLTPGNPGNSGGKPGRSGRKPEVYLELCRGLLNNPKTQASVKKILADADHPHFSSLYKHIAEHAYGKPTQPIGNPETGETVVRVIWDDVSAPQY